MGRDLIGLVTSRDEIDHLLKLHDVIDLVIPRGSNELVRSLLLFGGARGSRRERGRRREAGPQGAGCECGAWAGLCWPAHTPTPPPPTPSTGLLHPAAHQDPGAGPRRRHLPHLRGRGRRPGQGRRHLRGRKGRLPGGLQRRCLGWCTGLPLCGGSMLRGAHGRLRGPAPWSYRRSRPMRRSPHACSSPPLPRPPPRSGEGTGARWAGGRPLGCAAQGAARRGCVRQGQRVGAACVCAAELATTAAECLVLHLRLAAHPALIVICPPTYPPRRRRRHAARRRARGRGAGPAARAQRAPRVLQHGLYRGAGGRPGRGH